MGPSSRDRRSRTARTRIVRSGDSAPEAESPGDELSPGERFAFAFQLSLQQWRLAGWRDDRPGERRRDLLQSFVDRFLVVGGYALAVHGRPRATGDLDVWIDATPENAERVHAALREFGAPLHDLSREDLTRPGTVFQIGVPPCGSTS